MEDYCSGLCVIRQTDIFRDIDRSIYLSHLVEGNFLVNLNWVLDHFLGYLSQIYHGFMRPAQLPS